jgi:hypothetical protein
MGQKENRRDIGFHVPDPRKQRFDRPPAVAVVVYSQVAEILIVVSHVTGAEQELERGRGTGRKESQN